MGNVYTSVALKVSMSEITWHQYIIYFLHTYTVHFMFEFPCIISLYYIKNQQDATLAVLFISNCKITLHVLDVFCVHHEEY